jgi:hypothetical protein
MAVAAVLSTISSPTAEVAVPKGTLGLHRVESVACSVVKEATTPTKTIINVGFVPPPKSGERGNPQPIVVSAFFGGTSVTSNSKPDCSDVAGCNKADCNECIQLFWSSNPQTCTPGCVNTLESEAAWLKEQLEWGATSTVRHKVQLPQLGEQCKVNSDCTGMGKNAYCVVESNVHGSHCGAFNDQQPSGGGRCPEGYTGTAPS